MPAGLRFIVPLTLLYFWKSFRQPARVPRPRKLPSHISQIHFHFEFFLAVEFIQPLSARDLVDIATRIEMHVCHIFEIVYFLILFHIVVILMRSQFALYTQLFLDFLLCQLFYLFNFGYSSYVNCSIIVQRQSTVTRRQFFGRCLLLRNGWQKFLVAVADFVE